MDLTVSVDRLGPEVDGHRLVLPQGALDEGQDLSDRLLRPDQPVVRVLEQGGRESDHLRGQVAGDAVGRLVELLLDLPDRPLDGPFVGHADELLQPGESRPELGRVRVAGEPALGRERLGLGREHGFRRLAQAALARLLEPRGQLFGGELLGLPALGQPALHVLADHVRVAAGPPGEDGGAKPPRRTRQKGLPGPDVRRIPEHRQGQVR
jgi:hypothetical protein